MTGIPPVIKQNKKTRTAWAKMPERSGKKKKCLNHLSHTFLPGACMLVNPVNLYVFWMKNPAKS